VKDFFEKHELDVQGIVSLCTDGAQAKLGNKYGFSALVEQKITHMQGTQCFLHRHALAIETLLPKMKKMLDISVKTINCIRGHVLTQLCPTPSSVKSFVRLSLGFRCGKSILHDNLFLF